MDSTTASLIGVGVGALAGIGGSLLTNWLLLWREREQWLRDKLQEIYSNTIYFLSEPASGPSGAGVLREQLGDQEYAKMTIEYYNMLAKHKMDRLRWLNMLIVFHPFKGSDEFDQFVSAVREGKVTISEITDLASRDPRIRHSLEQKGISIRSPNAV